MLSLSLVRDGEAPLDGPEVIAGTQAFLSVACVPDLMSTFYANLTRSISYV